MLEPRVASERSRRPSNDAVPDDRQLFDANQRFYDALWRDAGLVQPERFNTWPLVQSLAADNGRQLEVAPGLRPRLPIESTHFIDISQPALAKLKAGGGTATLGQVSALPFPDESFDLICALDIVEHVEDDEPAFRELGRVASRGATLILSAPLYPERWNAFDDFVGHRRRYAPGVLLDKLTQNGYVLTQSAIYGMQPKSSKLLELGMWYLTHQRERAMWYYNRIFMPLGLRFQSKLALAAGLVDLTDVDEVLLVCRKQ